MKIENHRMAFRLSFILEIIHFFVCSSAFFLVCTLVLILRQDETRRFVECAVSEPWTNAAHTRPKTYNFGEIPVWRWWWSVWNVQNKCFDPMVSNNKFVDGARIKGINAHFMLTYRHQYYFVILCSQTIYS